MERSQRWPAFIAYFLPVVGWIYVALFQSKDRSARFHLRQSVGLFLFLILVTLAWGIVAWLLTWIPYLVILGMALFTLPMAAYIFAVIAWIIGMVNALRCREAYLPMIGGYCSRLPF